MAIYIISRDGVGDGSGLIIKSSLNCILLCTDARVNYFGTYVRVKEGTADKMWVDYTRGRQAFFFVNPVDLEAGVVLLPPGLVGL